MLVITEKPQVAKHFADALDASAVRPFEYRDAGNKYVITHCRGHLLSLWDAVQYDIRMKNWNLESLPVIPQAFKYNVIKETAKILLKVKELILAAVKNEEEIMVATDAGREGEVIARLVLNYAKIENYEKMSRFWVSESTSEKKVVLKGIEDRRLLKNYDALALEGLSWKKSDWIYGINLTVLFTLMAQYSFWKGKRETMNFGRVQTAVLYEVYRRQKEIENFKERVYKELEIITDDGIKAFLVKPDYYNGGDKKFDEDSAYIKNAEEEIKASRTRTLYTEDVEREQITREPPLLYSTSELQKEAYRLYGFSPAKTLQIMQDVYEKRGALSYPRTPSRVLGEGNEEKAQEWLEEQLRHEKEIEKYILRERFTLKNRRLFNSGKLDDHHGLVPTKYLEKEDTDEYKIWRLVQMRFLMQGMRANVTENVKIIFKMSMYTFIGRFKLEIFDGWKRFENAREKDEEEVLSIPVIRKGVLRNIKSWDVRKLKTKPPKLHNYSSILAFMQNPRGDDEEQKLIGIGTEATRASHIKGLEDHKMVTGKKGFTVTEKGERLLKLVQRCALLKDNIQAKETTEWEILGKKDPVLLLEKTKAVVKDVVEFYKKEEEKIKNEAVREVIGTCPLCGKRVYEGSKVYFCENFSNDKKCKYMLWKSSGGIEIKTQDAKDLFLKKTILKKGRGLMDYLLSLDEKGELRVDSRVRTVSKKAV